MESLNGLDIKLHFYSTRENWGKQVSLFQTNSHSLTGSQKTSVTAEPSSSLEVVRWVSGWEVESTEATGQA